MESYDLTQKIIRLTKTEMLSLAEILEELNISQKQIVDREERDNFLGTVEKTKKALWTALTKLDELTDM
jgi:hypothetical protein